MSNWHAHVQMRLNADPVPTNSEEVPAVDAVSLQFRSRMLPDETKLKRKHKRYVIIANSK